MSNFKKALILIVILLVLMPLGTVSADTGPKPTMDFTFTQQANGAPLTIGSGILDECEQPDCSDASPLAVGGPQRFTCDSISCHALSYLGFIHLNINKKQGKLELTLHQEVAYADPANGIYHDPGNL